MSGPLLKVSALGKRFGGFVALDAIDVTVGRGERLGLIGPNGSGKSTFVNCLGGVFPRHSGEIEFDGARITGLPPYRRAELGLARTFPAAARIQEPDCRRKCRDPVAFSRREGPLGSRRAKVAARGPCGQGAMRSREN